MQNQNNVIKNYILLSTPLLLLDIKEKYIKKCNKIIKSTSSSENCQCYECEEQNKD